MTDDEHASTLPTTPTLRETARRRVDLHAAVIGLELAAARPAPGREREWVNHVVEALEDLEREIEEHIDITESAGGLYDEIGAIAPRLLPKAERLRREHPIMLAQARDLRTQLLAAEVHEGWSVDDARSEAQRLFGVLVKHRQHGSDLVWEAYNLDIGGLD